MTQSQTPEAKKECRWCLPFADITAPLDKDTIPWATCEFNPLWLQRFHYCLVRSQRRQIASKKTNIAKSHLSFCLNNHFSVLLPCDWHFWCLEITPPPTLLKNSILQYSWRACVCVCVPVKERNEERYWPIMWQARDLILPKMTDILLLLVSL